MRALARSSTRAAAAWSGHAATASRTRFRTFVAVPTQFRDDEPYLAQADALLASVPLDPAAWQTEPLLIVPPGHAIIAALVLAAIHGRSGGFPAIVRLRPIEGAAARQFEVAELIGLQDVRDRHRKERQG